MASAKTYPSEADATIAVTYSRPVVLFTGGDSKLWSPVMETQLVTFWLTRLRALLTMKRPKTKHVKIGIRENGKWYEVSQGVAHMVQSYEGWQCAVVCIPLRPVGQPELFTAVDAEEVASEIAVLLRS